MHAQAGGGGGSHGLDGAAGEVDQSHVLAVERGPEVVWRAGGRTPRARTGMAHTAAPGETASVDEAG